MLDIAFYLLLIAAQATNWEKVTYGDNPTSPILSLEQTQTLFPKLNMYFQDCEAADDRRVLHYSSGQVEIKMPEDQYLILHITQAQTYDDYDQLDFFFTGQGESCSAPRRYFVENETVKLWNGAHGYIDGVMQITVFKRELNNNLEPGTAVLLHIPKGCSLTLTSVVRSLKQKLRQEITLFTENI